MMATNQSHAEFSPTLFWARLCEDDRWLSYVILVSRLSLCNRPLLSSSGCCEGCVPNTGAQAMTVPGIWPLRMKVSYQLANPDQAVQPHFWCIPAGVSELRPSLTCSVLRRAPNCGGIWDSSISIGCSVTLLKTSILKRAAQLFCCN